MRTCKLRVEIRVDRAFDGSGYNGPPTGKKLYYVMEAGPFTERLATAGCPMGRATELSEAIRDFCFRANLDQKELGLKPSECVIIETKDYSVE